jgi:hypothetical protein
VSDLYPGGLVPVYGVSVCVWGGGVDSIPIHPYA